MEDMDEHDDKGEEGRRKITCKLEKRELDRECRLEEYAPAEVQGNALQRSAVQRSAVMCSVVLFVVCSEVYG